MSQGGGTPAEATSSKQRQGLFGDIKISEQARWRSKNSARLGPVKRLYGILLQARQTNKRTYPHNCVQLAVSRIQ